MLQRPAYNAGLTWLYKSRDIRHNVKSEWMQKQFSVFHARLTLISVNMLVSEGSSNSDIIWLISHTIPLLDDEFHWSHGRANFWLELIYLINTLIIVEWIGLKRTIFWQGVHHNSTIFRCSFRSLRGLFQFVEDLLHTIDNSITLVLVSRPYWMETGPLV